MDTQLESSPWSWGFTHRAHVLVLQFCCPYGLAGIRCGPLHGQTECRQCLFRNGVSTRMRRPRSGKCADILGCIRRSAAPRRGRRHRWKGCQENRAPQLRPFGLSSAHAGSASTGAITSAVWLWSAVARRVPAHPLAPIAARRGRIMSSPFRMRYRGESPGPSQEDEGRRDYGSTCAQHAG